MNRRWFGVTAICGQRTLIGAIIKIELVYGAYRDPFVSFPIDEQCVDHAGRIRADLEQAGTPIGPFDLLIAATAVTHHLILVTHNTHEFERVNGLLFEDWELP